MASAPHLLRVALRKLRWWLLVLAAFLLHLPVLLPAPRPLSPAERALAAVATEALLRGDQRLDYGGFFLRSEGPSGQAAEPGWRALSASLKDQVGPLGGRDADDGIRKMMLLLFREAHLDQYHREEARMSGFFAAEAGGNCEAQTKLLLASLKASTLQLPEGKAPGVEVFQDHVQAVIVDRQRGTVWNLLTGEEDAAPRSDVYRPAVLLAAYLRGLGLKPPIPESALRMLKGPRPQALRRGWTFFTTSTMRLPAAAVRHTEGLAPERAKIPLPAGKRGSEPPPASGEAAAVGREAFIKDHDPLQLFAMDRVQGPFVLVGPTLVFRSQAQADRYLGLESQAERRRMLLGLVEDRLRDELAGGAPQLPRIEQLAGWREDAIGEQVRRMTRVEQLLALAELSVDRGRSGGLVGGELELRLPALRKVSESVRTFTADAGQEPERFLRALGALDRPRRRLLLGFFVPRFQSAQVKALAQVLGDERRLALSAGEQGPPLRALAPIEYTEVELLPDPAPLAPPPAPLPASPPAPREGQALAGEGGGGMEFPVGAYLDLALSGMFSSGAAQDAAPILARWSPEVSEALLRAAPPAPRCAELLIQAQMAVLKPLQEANLPTPAHLRDAIKKLERGCSR
jgi:hypothetical protein